jgi:type II secretory pathway component PulJ
MIGAAVASMMLAGLMAGSVALQRSFSASDRLSRAHADLLRVADYMARDIRNATSVNTTASSSVILTLTVPDYYDRRSTPTKLSDDVAINPTLARTGVTYGSNPVTIRYLRSGNRILREVRQIDGGAATLSTEWIADNVGNLAVAVDASGTAVITSASGMNYGIRKAGAQAPSLAFVMASKRRNPNP